MGGGRDKKKKRKAAAGPAAGAKSKDKEEQKKLRKQKKELDEPEEDIDALLEEFNKSEQDKFKVTEEFDCPPPSRRCNASLTANPLNPAELLLFGGEFYDGRTVHMYNELFRYNTEKKEWRKTTSPNSPGPRSSHQVVITPAGRLFLWGGEFVSPNETNFFHWKEGMWTMDLKANAWERLDMRNAPPPRSGHRMTLWKHYIVLFGGFFDNVTTTKYYDDTWLFDTLEFKWIKLDIPEPRPPSRSGCQLFTHNDTVCLFGGYSKVFVKGKKPVGVVHSDVWVLKMSPQVESIRWERRKKPGGVGPTQRSGCTMTVHKGRGILFGGVSDVQETEEQLESIYHNDLYQYQIDANKWFPLTLRPSAGAKRNKKKAKAAQQQQRRQDGSDVESGDEDDAAEGMDTDDVSEANPVEPIAPCQRFNTMLTVSRNILYMFGGILEDKSKEITLNDMWALNLDKLNEWVPLMVDDIQKAEWLGENSDDDDDDDDEDDDDDDDEEDEDDEDGDEDADEAGDGGQDERKKSKGRPASGKKSKDGKKRVARNAGDDRDEDEQEEGDADDAPEEATEAMADLSLKEKSEEEENLTEEERKIRAELEPLLAETLREYFTRTSVHWQIRAREESELTGKALRRDAFELAQEHFDEAQPELEKMRELMRQNEAIAAATAKAAADRAEEQRMGSRYRR
ncbi:hypothetical protein BC831DRAFT_455314 [Entophlyctis helioformis]|nr:hypothetical protein BC831DRAFT_455314 [Entophlyctis helioformis]